MRRLVIAIVVTTAACAPSVPAPAAPIGAVGRPEDRLELGSRYSTWGPTREGLYRGGQPVSLDEFLRVAGHGAVADEVATRRRVKRGLVAGGAVAFAAGVVLVVTAEECNQAEFELEFYYEACLDRRGDRRWIGLGVGLVGAAGFLAGLELSARRPSWDELSSWAAAHNRRHHIPPRRAPAITEVRLVPAIQPGAAGVVMTGRF